MQIRIRMRGEWDKMKPVNTKLLPVAAAAVLCRMASRQTPAIKLSKLQADAWNI